MKFCWSTLMVSNMDESIKFYKEIVGLEVNQRIKAGPGVELAFLVMGKQKLSSYVIKQIQKLI